MFDLLTILYEFGNRAYVVAWYSDQWKEYRHYQPKEFQLFFIYTSIIKTETLMVLDTIRTPEMFCRHPEESYLDIRKRVYYPIKSPWSSSFLKKDSLQR